MIEYFVLTALYAGMLVILLYYTWLGIQHRLRYKRPLEAEERKTLRLLRRASLVAAGTLLAVLSARILLAIIHG